MDYNNYEKTIHDINLKNDKIVEKFGISLGAAGLSNKTIRTHVSNITFFLNNFVSGYYEEGFEDASMHIDEFLGDWFIRKAAWSSESSIKSNIASLNRFYKFLYENDLVTLDTYQYVKKLIKEKKEIWIGEVNYYNSSSYFEF